MAIKRQYAIIDTTLNKTDATVIPELSGRQGDNGRVVYFAIKDSEFPHDLTGQDVSLKVRDAAGKIKVISGIYELISARGGLFSMLIPGEVYRAAGDVKEAYLTVENGDITVSSIPIAFTVFANGIIISANASEDYLSSVDELIDKVKGKIDDLEAYFKTLNDAIHDGFNYEPYLNGTKTIHDRAFDTTYTMIEIPLKDNDGDPIHLQRGLASDGTTATNQMETGYEWNRRNYATIYSNASTAQPLDDGTWQLRGRQVHNGKDIVGYESGVSANRWALAWEDDGWLKSYPPEVTADVLIDTYHVKEALTGFYPIYMNGRLMSEAWDKTGVEQHPRTAIFQRATGNLVFYSNDGRLGTGNVGMTLEQVYQAVTKHYSDIVFGYDLDGGGSSQLYEYGYNHTRPVDSLGNSTREVGDFIYVGKKPEIQRDKNIQHLIDMISNLREKQTDNEAYSRNRDPRINGYLQLGGENGTAGRGIYTRDENGRATNALWLNPGGLLEWYDREQRKDILKLDKKEIVYNGERWGKNMNRYIQTQNDTPIPNASPTGGYLVTKANPDNPFNVNAIIYLQNANNSTEIEEATPLASGIKNKKRFKTAGRPWSAWEDM